MGLESIWKVGMFICGVGEHLGGSDVHMHGWRASDVRFRTSDVDRQVLMVRMLLCGDNDGSTLPPSIKSREQSVNVG